MRIEEKYKNYRLAFRAIDENYDGVLNFKEFVDGFEKLGVRFSLLDFQKVFNAIDFDGNGTIDFSEFCMLNVDKSKDIPNQIREIRLSQKNSLQTSSQNFKKPPLPSIMTQQSFNKRIKNYSFASGMLPKNKDISKFTKDVQVETLSEFKQKNSKEGVLPCQTDS